MAAYNNKNGFRIQCKPFTAFKNFTDFNKPQADIFKYMKPDKQENKSGILEDGGLNDLGKDIELNDVDDNQFQIKFVDFSQRRKVGFRGAFEFENKHIMIASQSQVRILVYFQNFDATSLEN